jgi:FkbM family methyltransferase
MSAHAIHEVRSKLSRSHQGLKRRLRRLRNAVEWHGAQAFRHESPWCYNRWGHRYRAVSLQEYDYLRDGNPETHEAALLERLLRPGMTVVDVGANHGLFSLEAAHFVGPEGRIHAFEPAPATYDCLMANLRANGLEDVRVFRSALGAEPGSARLRVHREWSGLNTLADRDITWMGDKLSPDEVIEVPVTTLEAHAAAEGLDRIDFLKIDVEGFELSVLRGARSLLADRKIDRIMLEVGDVTCANAGVEPAAILAELAGLGYGVYGITPDGSIVSRIASFPAGSFSANYLAFHEEG